MKLTEQRLIEIIKEEYQSILNEKTIRMGDLDLIFQGDKVQLDSIGSKLKIHTHRGPIEIKGHKQLSQFVNILSKNMGIV